MSNQSPAIQDHYPDTFSHCYGCGSLNEHGLRLKSRWEGDELVATFTPAPYHIAAPGIVYGGLIASLLDCHGMATAAAATERAAGRDIGEEPSPRYVTAMLKVDYLRPTPLGPELRILGRAAEVGRRKALVFARIEANGEVTAQAEIVAVPLPESIQAMIEGA